MHRTRNAAYGQPYRGFESLPLRHPTPRLHQLGGISNPRCIPLLAFVFDKARSKTTRSLRERYGFESLPLRHPTPQLHQLSGIPPVMDWKAKEDRLNEIWGRAPLLENQGQYVEALALWREAYELKRELGITGAGDVGELSGIKDRIGSLSLKLRSKN
jgi:hypothetical protein